MTIGPIPVHVPVVELLPAPQKGGLPVVMTRHAWTQWFEAFRRDYNTLLAAGGQSNTASSSSSGGEGLVLAKVGADLPFRGIRGGAGITASADATDVSLAVAMDDTVHGDRGGGALHADVVAAGADGFMTGADKTKLEGLPSAPIMASDVEALQVGTPTYDDLQDFLNLAWSGGQFTGGEVSDGGGETVDCAAMTGMIRDADSAASNTLFFDVVADNLAIPTDTTRFVRINYNAGTPVWELSTTEDTSREDIIHMAKVTNDGGVLHISSLVDHAGNIPNRFSHVLKSVFGVRRADNLGGLMLGEGGTRYITVSAGQIFYGEHGNDFTAKDTDPGGGADTFDTEYFNGSVWVTTTGVSQWPNTQYNNIASGLVTMTNNRWAVLWFYAETDDDLSMIYGSAQYTSRALAELETVPASIPDKLFEHGLLIGRLIFQKSAAVAEVESAFIQAFVPTTVISHIDLPDLTTGDAGHTQLHTDAKALTWLADGGAEGGQPVSLWEQIKAGFNLNGGGIISLSAGGVFKWTARFIVISNGRGAHFSNSGFFDIIKPDGGILVGVGGASDRTWTTAGIVLNAWEALYYILPIGSGSSSLAANFRVADYRGAVEVPANWILLAVRNGDYSIVKVSTGIHLGLGESRTNNTINAKVDGIASNANNYSHPNHTGDVTSVGDGAQTIISEAVTNAKLQHMQPSTIKGRITGQGIGDPSDLTPATVRTILNVEDGATADQTAADINGLTLNHSADHERAGSDEIDGDHLDIDFTPSNYTPDASPAEAADVNDLTAHLKGLDTAVGASGGGLTISKGEQIKAGFNVSDGGTISVDGSGVFKWTTTFRVLSNGRGSHFSTTGYFVIQMPTSGTLVGVGGASNQTWTVAGMTLGLWNALYYILPIGSDHLSIAANFRVAAYTSDLEVPADWLLLAVYDGINVKVCTGTYIAFGESRTNNSINAKVDGIEALAEVNNISDANATALTDAGETALHSHAGDAGGLLAGPFTDSGASSRTFPVSSYTGYKDLILEIDGWIPGTDDRTIFVRLNGDSGANYGWANHYGNWNATHGMAVDASDTEIEIGAVGANQGAGTGAGEHYNVRIIIPDFQNTSIIKTLLIQAWGKDAGATAFNIVGTGLWNNTAAITSVFLQPEGGGTYSSKLTLYGKVNA